jgi:hypothetical protein
VDTRDPIKVNDRFRQEICAWLDANGLDSRHTPPDARPSIVDGKLTIEQQLVIDGALQVDAGGGGRHPDGLVFEKVKTHTVTVDVKVPPTPAVEYWLMEPCTECGR